MGLFNSNLHSMEYKYTVYVEIFAVDLISQFSQVHAPTMKLKTAKISCRNPHTSISPITATSMSPKTWKPLIMLSVVCASMMIGRMTAV